LCGITCAINSAPGTSALARFNAAFCQPETVVLRRDIDRDFPRRRSLAFDPIESEAAGGVAIVLNDHNDAVPRSEALPEPLAMLVQRRRPRVAGELPRLRMNLPVIEQHHVARRRGPQCYNTAVFGPVGAHGQPSTPLGCIGRADRLQQF